MTLGPGTRLGPYENVAAVGAGGMGEVWRARDTRLGRDVAIKVLPVSVATDPDRLARFEQEARAAAALNHPNILALYDVGTHDGAPYIVSELLDGDTLREQIGALAVRKAVDHAIQIARGLAAAHDKGIVHRDLKPENVFVTRDGRLKILDFGLAKLTQGEASRTDFSRLPTGIPDTQPGVVLGTIGYMAPEQVRGQTADHRADIFSLGAILYEMVAGQRAFQGETAADTMTAILKSDPPDLAVERQVSPACARLVARCLEKAPVARFQSASDLAFALEAIAGQSPTAVADAQAVASPRRRVWPVAAAIVTIAALVSAAVILGAGVLRRDAVADEATTVVTARFPLFPPEDTIFSTTATNRARFAVSPDGRHIAFVAETNGITNLWLRSLDSPEARQIPGTSEVRGAPIWSPDSRSLAFFSNGKLRQTDLTSTAPRPVADAPGPIAVVATVGGSWSQNGTLIFETAANSPIFSVSANGGSAVPVTHLLAGSVESHDLPSFLPDGRHFVFTSRGVPEREGVWIGTLDGAESTRLMERATQAHFSQGFLLFIRDGILQAQPYDSMRNQLTGEARPLGEPTFGDGLFSVSQTGVLVHVSGIIPDRQFLWVDRGGRELSKVQEPAPWGNFDLSPDERYLVASRGDARVGDIWSIDLTRGVQTRLTFSGALNGSPVWSPDGQQIAFNHMLTQSDQGTNPGECHVVLIPAAGGAETVAYDRKERGCINLDDWSPDGRFITFNRDPALMALPTTGEPKPFPFVQTMNANLDESHFSPDGKWIAYNSNESGTWQVYLAPFPQTGERWQISADGGVEVRWRSDGQELYYLTFDGQMMAVDVRLGPKPAIGQARFLFQSGIAVSTRQDQYAVSHSGQRFLLRRQAANGRFPINVVLNWDAGLK